MEPTITQLIDQLRKIEVDQRALEIERVALSESWTRTMDTLKETIESTPNGQFIAMEYFGQI